MAKKKYSRKKFTNKKVIKKKSRTRKINKTKKKLTKIGGFGDMGQKSPLEKKIDELKSELHTIKSEVKKNNEKLKNNEAKEIDEKVTDIGIEALKDLEKIELPNELVEELDSEWIEDFLTKVITAHLPVSNKYIEELINKSIVKLSVNTAKYGLNKIDDLLFFTKTGFDKKTYYKELEKVKQEINKNIGMKITKGKRSTQTDEHQLLVDLIKGCRSGYSEREDDDSPCKEPIGSYAESLSSSSMKTIEDLLKYIAMQNDDPEDNLTVDYLKDKGILT